jgi:hypothetical protein
VRVGCALTRVCRQSLIEVQLPLNAARDQPTNNVFKTLDADTCDGLLLLVQGSGAVRAGMWARAVCINDSLEMGSVLPYLVRARRNNMGVVVFNPNLNSVDVPPRTYTQADFESTAVRRRDSTPQRIVGSESPSEVSTTCMCTRDCACVGAVQHTLTVWDTIVAHTKAREIVIVAHSAGGYCTMELLRHVRRVLHLIAQSVLMSTISVRTTCSSG